MDNARCVSWVLKNITDPEALDAAIPLAGNIRWFEDGIDVKPPYSQIVFTFDRCFSSGDGMLHPRLRDRAYCSAQAILWIYALAPSKECRDEFPIPIRRYRCSSSDPDLQHLLHALRPDRSDSCLGDLLDFCGTFTRPHMQWTSSVLLYLSRTTDRFRLNPVKYILEGVNTSTPPDAIFNLLLTCSNLLGSPVREEALITQDKSYGISSPFSTNSLH